MDFQFLSALKFTKINQFIKISNINKSHFSIEIFIDIFYKYIITRYIKWYIDIENNFLRLI